MKTAKEVAQNCAKPIYKHDCCECKYVKTDEYQGRMVDFYVCGNDDTVVYRDGNEPSMNGAVCFSGKDQFIIERYADLFSVLQEFHNAKKVNKI